MLIKIAESSQPPLHLALGGDAVAGIQDSLQYRFSDLQTWQQESLSTDIQRSDRTLLWLNILLLLCIVFLPFPMALLGQYPEQRISVIIYAGTLVITGLVLQLLWWYATSSYRLVDKEIDPKLVRRATRRSLMAPLIYLLAIGISFLSVQISLIFFIVVPILYIFPGRIDRHWMLRHTHRVSPHQDGDLSGDEGSRLSRMSPEER